MKKQIEYNSKTREMLWKLECKRAFTEGFGSAQEYWEWCLQKALDWVNRYPYRDFKKDVRF